MSKLNTELRDSVYSLENHGEITYEKIGFPRKINPRWKTRQWVRKNASIEDLHILKNYPSGVVKTTAYEMLILREKGSTFDLWIEAFQDTTHFVDVYTGGCIGYTNLAGEYLYDEYLLAFSYNEPSETVLNRFQLNKEEFYQIKALYEERRSKKSSYLKAFYYVD